jgi:restriction system protein
MLKTLFEILAEEPDGLRAKDAIARVEARLEATPFEKATFPKNPDLVRFPKLLRFATIFSVKAGWLRKKSGVWTISESGIAALKAHPDPEALYAESRRLYKLWRANQPDPEPEPATDEPADDGSEPGLIAATTLEEAEESALTAIRDYMAAVNPYVFQDLVGKLLEAMGYHVLWNAPLGKDGGLDLLAQTDPLGVKGPRIKCQVKRREQKATAEEIRSFLSLIEQDDVGVFISLSGFTKDSEELIRFERRRITMIDGDSFLKLWVTHYESLDEAGRQLLPLRPVYFLDVDA